jgi:hypothetical protein
LAGLHEHDIAQHELLGVDLDGLTVATHTSDAFHHLFQGSQAGLGLGFLIATQDGVENHQTNQHESRAQLAGENLVDHSRGQRENLHEVLVLAQEGLPARLPFSCRPIHLRHIAANAAALRPRSILWPGRLSVARPSPPASWCTTWVVVALLPPSWLLPQIG